VRPVRRQSLVAGAVLTAALVTLVALPGVAGSETPSSARSYSADAFQSVRLPAADDASPVAIRRFDAGYESAGHLDDTTPLIEVGQYAPPTKRSTVELPVPRLITEAPRAPKVVLAPKPAAVKPAPTVRHPAPKPAAAPAATYRRVLTGLASWYDNGTTAMRYPRGTHIKICGARSCVTTVVRDWGPAAYLSARIVDMTPGDFVRVTGKSLGAGLAPVTVYIY
jgi:hypothetical protein